MGCTADVITQSGTSVSQCIWAEVARDWRNFCHLGSQSAGTLSCNPARPGWRVNEVCVYIYNVHISSSHLYFVCAFARFMCIVVNSVGLYLDRDLLFLIIGGPVRFYIFFKNLLNKDQTF